MSNVFIEEATLWLGQAQMDWETASQFAKAIPYAACFYSQQSAEKSLTALYALEGLDVPRIHSIGRLLSGLTPTYKELEAFPDVASVLDAYYIGTRYPSGEMGQIPGKNYTGKNATDAVAIAQNIVSVCQTIFGRVVQKDPK
ncbi:MAG: HEPN domain-containing protein [Firmicutes bacterium]|nr:HEPN domain-containing protein [Bacillota bacterium]